MKDMLPSILKTQEGVNRVLKTFSNFSQTMESIQFVFMLCWVFKKGFSTKDEQTNEDWEGKI